MAQTESTRILVADSTDLGCQLFRRQLEQYSFQVVAQARDVAKALQECRQKRPDVALVAARLADGPLSGLHLLRALRAEGSAVLPVMLLDAPDRDLTITSFRCGARGIFRRSDSIELLAKCLHAVRLGQVWADSQELQYLLDAFSVALPASAGMVDDTRELTPREGEIARLVAEGLSNRQISAQLNLSEHTIKNCLHRVYEKVGVSNRVELALYSMTHPPSSV